MARKQLTAVRLTAGAPATGWQLAHIERVTTLEDGKQFPRDEPRDQVARAVNAGDPYYVRTADGAEVPVRAQLRHGKYLLVTTTTPGEPEPLLALPVHGR